METIAISPLRTVKLTNTSSKILLTKEDNLTEQEWETLRKEVEDITKVAVTTLKQIKVELTSAFGKDYISVTPGEGQEPEDLAELLQTIIHYDFKSALADLAAYIEVGLQISGYTVKRTEPQNSEMTAKSRRESGNALVAHFLVEDDCITIGISNFFNMDPSIAVNPDIILKDIGKAIEDLEKFLRIVKNEKPKPFEDKLSEVLESKSFLNGTSVFGVAELIDKNLRSEELIVGARVAKRVLEAKGYEIKAERARLIVEPLTL